MPSHDYFMQRALSLASKASGFTSPNPLVGAVVVRDNSICGEGWHQRAGQAHAEIEAIRDAKGQTHGATLYVTLEPCSHHGRTPPCTQAIIEAGLSTVVFAAHDSNAVACGGALVLEQAGINVIQGVCEQQARHQNRFFFHHLETGLPYVIAKFASSLDGRIATRTGHSQWITGSAARQRGHDLRQAVDAILVGAQTVIDDDPQLTVRTCANHETAQEPTPMRPAHPLRIVLDSHGRVPLTKQLVSGKLPGKTMVISTEAMPTEHERQLNNNGIEVLRLSSSKQNKRPLVTELLKTLGERSIQSLLIEGGPTVHGSFFDQQLVNEVWAFIAPMVIGGKTAPPSVAGIGCDVLNDAARLTAIETEFLEPDILIKGQIKSTKDKN